MRKMLLSFVAILFLSGCVAHTKVIKPLHEDYQSVINVQKVQVAYSNLTKETIEATDEKLALEGKEAEEPQSIKYRPLKETLAEISKESLELRDGEGEYFADIHIEVDNLKFVDPMAAFLIGDTDQLTGTVRVVDSKTQEILTEFYVDVLKGTGGLLGLAIRGGGVREKLSAQFAEYIGDELGFKKLQNTSTASSTEKK